MARDVRVAILGDSRDFSRAVKNAQQDADRLNSKFRTVGTSVTKFGKAAAVGLAGISVGAVALGKSFVDAAVESQKVTKQTEAVIKSMGGATKVTAKQVADLAASISMKTGVDDEAIQAGQNLLLTFGNIRNEAGKGNDIFNKTTQIMTDMSVALGQDMKSSALQLGKALNDPVKGVTALQRVGVSFSKKQKETIKRLVETGDTLGAQKLILKELDKQFAGSAKAQSTAGDRLRVVWGNLQEQLGEKLLPVVEKVASFLADKLPDAIAFAQRTFGPLAKQVSRFWNALTTGFTEDEGTPIELFALKVRDALGKLIAFVQEWAPRIIDAALAFGQTLLDWWSQHGPEITKTAQTLAEDFQRYILEPMQAIASFVVEELVPKVATFVTWIAENEHLIEAFGVLIGVTLVAHYVKLATQATISATKQAAAWLVTRTEAIRTAAVYTAQVAIMVGKWALLAARAVVHAAVVAGAWVVTTVAGTTATAAHAAAVTVQTAGWAGLARAAAINSASIARSWLAVLGPMGAVIAAAETLNNLTGNKLNPNNLNLLERLNPFKAFNGLSFDIPGFASGVRNFGGGLAVVGERGPELLNLPGGSDVIPLRRGGSFGATITNNIYMPPGSDGEDVVNAIRRYERRNGTSWRS